MLRKGIRRQALSAARRATHNSPTLLRAPVLRETPGEDGGPTEVFAAAGPIISLEERRSLDDVPRMQEHENDPAAFVLLHMPGHEIVMGSYHPCGALFECTISLNRARECIQRLREVLDENGIPARTLGEIMRMGHFTEDREQLKKMASSSLTYEVREKDEPYLMGEELRLASDQYKNDVVGGLDVRDLPTVSLAKSGNNTPLKSTGYRFEPLSNLIVTAKGAVLANLNSGQRAPEVKVVQFCLEKLGINVQGKIEAPGTLEGGDFFPAGRDLCFIGMGIRTNDAAIQHMLKKDMFGTRRVAVVADLFDRNQARMHLDCVAGIASENCIVVRESIIGKLNPKRRLVTEYTQNEQTGEYEVSVEHMEFGEYLTANGWHIIPASEQMADDLGINFINMGNGQLICTDEAMGETIENFPHFRGKVHVIDYREICKMYGAIHCTTQVFRHGMPDSEKPSTGVTPDFSKALSTFTEKVQFIPDEKSQTTNSVLLVAPTQFGQNNETLQDNEFMTRDKKHLRSTDIDVIDAACEEFQSLYSSLLREGVNIKLYHHEPYHGTPDACFPNNWFSTHRNANGSSELVLYPMAHPSRRRERRPDILKYLNGRCSNLIDLSDHEDMNMFLEGTGSMVLDRIHRIAYAVVSSRTDETVLGRFCEHLGFKPFPIHTKGNMYHTNVMMSIGTKYAAVCFDHLKDQEEVSRLYNSLKQTGRTIVTLSEDQCTNMCGNILELRSEKGEAFLAMSDRAYSNFNPQQLYSMLQCVDHIVHPDYATIENVCFC